MKDEQQRQSELIYLEYREREQMPVRAPYIPELAFYSAVKQGETELVRIYCEEPLEQKEGLGVLSENPLQNLIYHFVITAALLARYCIEGGMEVSAAYGLSDYYIREADQTHSTQELSALHAAMCMDYTRKMQALQKKEISSLPVIRCIDYIYDHLHTKITLEDLAGTVSLSADHLSRLFKQETGLSVHAYIEAMKIKTAKNLLVYSSYSIAEIAATLAFSNQSHFTRVFRKYAQITPKKYRDRYARRTFINL